MRILLINVPHPSIGSRIPDDHLPPLGLLAVGGPLLDDGHEVRLVDGEFDPMSTQGLVAAAMAFAPDAVLFGHSGSTSGHPVIAEVAHAMSAALPVVSRPLPIDRGWVLSRRARHSRDQQSRGGNRRNCLIAIPASATPHPCGPERRRATWCRPS